MSLRGIYLFIFLFFISALIISQEQIQGPVGSPSVNLNQQNHNQPEPEYPSDPNINRIISIVSEVEEKSKFIDALSPDSTASLPFGIIKQIGEVRYTIAVDSMKFKNDGAYFSAYAALDFPGTVKKLAFRASQIKFNPSGVVSGQQSRLYLVSDHLIRINSTVSLKLSAKAQNWVEWDCNGFKAINLVGHFVFRKSKLIPDPSQTNDTVVTASFQIYTENLHNFIAGVNITPFMINGLKDWSFNVNNAIVDMSELSNSNFMVFPKGYENPNLISPLMWTGFALQSLKIKLPKEISKNGRRMEIVANNLLIDNMGLTGMFQANNLFNIHEGSMSGWDFSVDEIGIGFNCNRISSGHLGGLVQIPIIDSAESLKYSADVSHNYSNQETDYVFCISPTNGVRFNVFSANVALNSNSRLVVNKVNGYLKPSAVLNGSIAFDDAKLNTGNGKLAFQQLVIVTDAPYIINGVFSLNTINGNRPKHGNYPLTIENITFGIDNGAPILGFGVRFNLSELVNTSLTVGTSILLKGKIETRQQVYGSGAKDPGVTFNKTRWTYDRAIINGVDVDLETTPFTLKGNIQFNENHPVFGSGFYGMLDLSIKKVIEDPIGVTVCFGSKEDYRYFFMDAKVPMKYIVPGTPIGLSRLVGGLYYHMKPNKLDQAGFIELTQNFNNISNTALTYVPDKNTSIGFKLGATGEFIMNEAVCNGDFMLDLHFNKSGGLGIVSLGGNVYSMATIAKRTNAPVKGQMEMTFDPATKTFDALAKVNMSYHGIISGSGYMKTFFSPEKWYVCIGKPSAPNNVSLLNLINAPSYFMTGNDLEPCMQPPPSVANESLSADVISSRDQTKLQNARGFVAGARIKSDLQKKIGGESFNVQGAFKFDLGFDMMMNDYGENAICGSSEEKVGLNGRLAQGNMYLAMNGAVSISGHFKFPKDCPNTYKICDKKGNCCCETTLDCLIDADFDKTIFNAGFNSIVNASVPKPLYFKGTLNCSYNIFDKETGSLNFDYEYGNNCNPTIN